MDLPHAFAFRLAVLMGNLCFPSLRDVFWISDDFDLRFPFGKQHLDVPVISDVLVQVFHVALLVNLSGGLEAVIMYRMRGEKLPPGNNRVWWLTSKQLGRGTLACVALTWLIVETIHFQWLVLMEIRVVADRESAMAEYCNNSGCMSNL